MPRRAAETTVGGGGKNPPPPPPSGAPPGGAARAPDPQCLPFDPPDFADAANNEWLGFHYRAPA
ncbi:DUF6928 family protein, partial [Nocardia farcinica]|uniref:DUF6928 family protein n=1 Tax=Nocardia farcinica TaxID=37329 RepID=UPI003CC7F73F